MALGSKTGAGLPGGAASNSGRPSHRDKRYIPWFRVPDRENKKLRIIFGHWSTLGPVTDKNVFPLDTGCVWGGKLTALRLEDQALFQA